MPAGRQIDVRRDQMEKEWDGRPDPELLLRQNFPDSNNKGRGKLKIFFGYAAGVGKTFAMLEAARQEKAGGRDVVVGYIEPHDRPDTLALLDGLELLTPKYVEYKGITAEFDLDGFESGILTWCWWMSWPIPTPRDAGIKSGIRT